MKPAWSIILFTTIGGAAQGMAVVAAVTTLSGAAPQGLVAQMLWTSLAIGAVLVDPAQAKGLEFDAVVIAEPAAIARTDHGLRHLYVAMTRAVQHLGLVHAEPLPAALALTPA